MKFLCLALLVVAFATYAQARGTNYAVLVAGSNGYYNYRHQADICHSFQVLTQKGNIPPENIIVFMYDDIANNAQNPTKGVIINHPSGGDVYKGVNKDYTGAAVTPANFLAVLSQNKSAINGGSGRVLETGPEDNLFIYFSDHGAPGLIAFPSEYLYATDLINTLKLMNEKKFYKEMVIYIEACESGSMFANILPSDISIYATTASTPDQSSYACYWDASRQAYLGDEYSVRWMEDSDVHDAASPWTLLDQFKIVANETLQSQPQQYGNLQMNTEDIDHYQALNKFTKTAPKTKAVRSFTPCGTPTDSRDVKLHTLINMRNQATNGLLQQKLDAMVTDELASRARWDFVFDHAVFSMTGAIQKKKLLTARTPVKNFTCLKESMFHVENACGKLDDYSLKWVYVLVNLCEGGYAPQEIKAGFRTACQTL